MQFKYFLPALSVAVLGSWMLQADPSTQSQSSPVLAKVGTRTITRADLEARKDGIRELAGASFESVYAGLAQQVVAEMILQEESSKANLDNDPELLEKVKKFKELAKMQTYLEKQVDKRITTEDLLKLYNEVSKEFKPKREINGQHILIRPKGKTAKDDTEALARAQKAISALDSGKDFETVVRESSDDDTTKANGGALGYFNKDIAKEAFGEAFAESVFILKPGFYTKKPVKSELGYHIVKVTKERDSTMPKFEEIAPQLRKIKSQQVLLSFIEELMKKKNVKFFDLNGKEIPMDGKSGAKAAAKASS